MYENIYDKVMKLRFKAPLSNTYNEKKEIKPPTAMHKNVRNAYH